jgi:hypothetical protein
MERNNQGDTMSVNVRRKARKAHWCDGCERAGKIQSGDVYLTHTALAGDDYYHDALDRDTLKPANRPQRYAECSECATRYGRAELLELANKETP